MLNHGQFTKQDLNRGEAMEKNHNKLSGARSLPAKLCGAGVAVVAAVAVVLSITPAQAAFVELGAAGFFTVLSTNQGTQGADIDIGSAATTITGNVGLGPYSFGTAEKATINGNLYVDSTSTTSIHPDLVHGNTFTSQNLNGPVSDAFAASNFFHSLAPNQTYGDVTGNFTFSGGPGRSVISLSSVNTQATLTISGSASSQFIFNITNGFILNGGIIQLTGGVTADNVLFNLVGTGNGVTIDKPVGDAAGIFLAPLRDIILDKATLEGAIIGGGGGNGLTVHSGANLIGVIPEPPTYLAGLLAIAVLLLSHAKLLFARKETSRTDATSNCCGQKGKNSRRS